MLTLYSGAENKQKGGAVWGNICDIFHLKITFCMRSRQPRADQKVLQLKKGRQLYIQGQFPTKSLWKREGGRETEHHKITYLCALMII